MILRSSLRSLTSFLLEGGSITKPSGSTVQIRRVDKPGMTTVWWGKSDIYKDDRGAFLETYNSQTYKRMLKQMGLSDPTFWLQDNVSYSKHAVLRGLHYSVGKTAQSKLVRCLRGRVLDVVVQVDPDKYGYLSWVSLELSEENCNFIFVPRGFAHGFIVLSDDAIVTYKVDNIYDKESERGVCWNDPLLKIDWNLSQLNRSSPIVMPRDESWPLLQPK